MSKSFSGIQFAQRGKKLAIQLTKRSATTAERNEAIITAANSNTDFLLIKMCRARPKTGKCALLYVEARSPKFQAT
jgi:hypothetical protein